MLYLFGDETGNPGVDKCFCLGFLITKNPRLHINKIREIRDKYNYNNREIKYSGTDYYQILPSIDLIDYFFESKDLGVKVMVKDKEFFDFSYYIPNRYNVKENDLAYISSYCELTRNIRTDDYKEKEKFCVVDQKPHTAEGILSEYVTKHDTEVIYFEQKDSAMLTNSNNYHGYSEMLQFADLITGIVGGLCSDSSGRYQDVYKKRFLTNCNNKEKELSAIYENKRSFYLPSHPGKKINIWYWKPRE